MYVYVCDYVCLYVVDICVVRVYVMCVCARYSMHVGYGLCAVFCLNAHVYVCYVCMYVRMCVVWACA